MSVVTSNSAPMPTLENIFALTTLYLSPCFENVTSFLFFKVLYPNIKRCVRCCPKVTPPSCFHTRPRPRSRSACNDLRSNKHFENFITLMILIVAIQIGVETDGHVIPGGTIIGYILLAIFTFEVIETLYPLSID